ncbi:MAG: PA0069 family radical SAM protein [Burkholderiales bacterium]|nr:PA0069 family radical SAM protein [Burkholderiales bacterium]
MGGGSDRKTGVKGRGSADRRPGRFERVTRESEPAPDLEPDAEAPRTAVIEQRARSIIARNDSPDVPFSQSINVHAGCEHGCAYCYARPSHAYLGLSPGLDFETKIHAKMNAAALLREELSRPGYRCDMISVGANTDPYQPVERDLRLTRGVLEVLREFRHPVRIVTKSALVERDLDILAEMAGQRLAHVHVSVTTLDPELARRLEPRASAPDRRLRAIERIVEAGVPCGVLVAPVIPFLNDEDMEAILEAAAAAGADSAGYAVIRLPFEVKGLFKAWLARHYPLRAERVMARIRDLRDGRENDPEFGTRMRGTGVYAALVRQRFARACKRFGIDAGERPALDTALFRVLGRHEQLPLW